MALSEHTIRAGVAAIAIWLALEQSAGAQNRPLPMRVVVYDYADTAPAMLQQAQGIVSGIFREIDVDVDWLDQAEFAREMPAEPAGRRAFVASVIYVSLLPPAMHKALGRKGGVLGGRRIEHSPHLDLALQGRSAGALGEGRRERRAGPGART